MKKTFVYTLIILGLLMSCRAQKMDSEFHYGTFYAVDQKHKGLPSYFYTLKLYQDSTFLFAIKVDLGGSHCSGKWEITNNTLMIECDEVIDPMESLTRGGMSGVQELEILSKDKLKFKDVILERNKYATNSSSEGLPVWGD